MTEHILIHIHFTNSNDVGSQYVGEKMEEDGKFLRKKHLVRQNLVFLYCLTCKACLQFTMKKKWKKVIWSDALVSTLKPKQMSGHLEFDSELVHSLLLSA